MIVIATLLIITLLSFLDIFLETLFSTIFLIYLVKMSKIFDIFKTFKFELSNSKLMFQAILIHVISEYFIPENFSGITILK